MPAEVPTADYTGLIVFAVVVLGLLPAAVFGGRLARRRHRNWLVGAASGLLFSWVGVLALAWVTRGSLPPAGEEDVSIEIVDCTAADPMSFAPRQPEWKRTLRVFMRRKIAVVGISLVVLMILVAIFAPLLTPYDYKEINLDATFAHPSSEHLLGTDGTGRDTLSRCIYGARTSLLIGICAVTLGAVIGQLLGLLAGYYGGWVYTIIMRLVDAMMAIPMIALALVISAVLGGGIKNVIIALAIGGIPGQARMMCAQTLSVKHNDYVLAGRTIGAGRWRMMLRHVYPNAFPPCLVLMTIGMGATILAEAGLSFLGAGIDEPTAAWGLMIKLGYNEILKAPELSIAPGFFIMMLVFGFNMMGDGLRDALDPRLRGTI